MIKVTIELVPYGIDDPVVLHEGIIVNDLTGTKTRGNYQYRFHDKSGRSWKAGALHGFKRREKSAWWLLYLCLREALDV